jgi:hypothetical protein
VRPLRELTPREARVRAAAFLVGWSFLVAGALVLTLRSLSRTDFDGLNNFWQIPLALPWFLLPIGVLTRSHHTDAWIAAGMGLVNGVIIAAWIAHRHERT